MTQRFYTYVIQDPKHNIPIYVGKGKDNRVMDHFRPGSATHIGRTIKKRIREGFSVVPHITYHVDEETAFGIEKFWIMYFGRADLGTGPLLNKSDGGDGPSGSVRTPEMRKKTSEIRKGMSNNWTGRRHSEESKKKISDSKRSVPNSTEHNAAISTARKGMSNNWTGRKHSEESKKKISAGCKGKSNNWTGRKHSEETKTKMAAARLGKKFPRVK